MCLYGPYSSITWYSWRSIETGTLSVVNCGIWGAFRGKPDNWANVFFTALFLIITVRKQTISSAIRSSDDRQVSPLLISLNWVPRERHKLPLDALFRPRSVPYVCHVIWRQNNKWPDIVDTIWSPLRHLTLDCFFFDISWAQYPMKNEIPGAWYDKS